MTKAIKRIITRQQNKTKKALRLLIESNLILQLQEPAIECRMTTNTRNYIKDFCTVKMSSSRRSGHTSSMLSVALEMFAKPLFVTENTRMAERLKEILMTDFNISKKNARCMVSTARDLRKLACPEEDAIFVDPSSMLTRNDEDDILGYAQGCLPAKRDCFCLVFVG